MDLAVSRPASLDSIVAQELRNRIIRGELESGAHLSEPLIARTLRVSRSPVRAALQQLKDEGLVVRRANLGSFVRDFTVKDIDEIYSLRGHLEVLAAEWALEHFVHEDLVHLDQLRIAHQRLVREKAARIAVYEADIAFHEYMCIRSGHDRLMTIWQGIRSQCMCLFRLQDLYGQTHEGLRTSVSDHDMLFSALKEGDLDTVRATHRAINARVSAQMRSFFAGRNS